MNKEIINKEEVLEIAIEAIKSKIGERFTGYSSPLNNIIDNVIKDNSEKIQSIVSECLEGTLGNKKFKETIKEEFTHKIAKSLVGKLEGSVEKAVEVLRQNPTLKAKMIIAIEKVINDNQ